MLSVNGLVKVYKTKGGVEVRALDNVSVDFPDTGLVFLLGKSGSGKSTLLNVSGGLDTPDEGEIIVKGRSSKNFTSADFDSYRNTYVGFIFQEYNILNEFTIEQNIALALQLQNKPNNNEAVKELLKMVDLDGLGKRKPNTLSGGQKQRVAIARALIKEPEIIMADEPTGALDSNTGKQVFETLKKLSKNKLVIVVSHDREFAEQYGDRIIELSDGKIISDVTKACTKPQNLNENITVLGDDTITVKDWNNVSESDIKNIVDIMKKNGGETVITSNVKDMPDIKRACKINDSGNKEYFKKTTNVELKDYDGTKTKFIKSKLPIRHAVKMAGNGLKVKPFRLIFTLFLCVIAFGMFGIVSTMMMYKSDYSIAKAIESSNYESIVINKTFELERSYNKIYRNGKIEKGSSWTNSENTFISTDDLRDLNKNETGLNFAGILNLCETQKIYGSKYYTYYNNDSRYSVVHDVNIKSEYQNYYTTSILGFTDCGNEFATNSGFSLVAGTYPENKNEIAITEYIFGMFKNSIDSVYSTPDDIVGKTIKIGFNEFVVTGVYNVGEISTKYDELSNSSSQLDAEQKRKLKQEFNDYINNSFHTVVFVNDEFYNEYKIGVRAQQNKIYINNTMISNNEIDQTVEGNMASVYLEKDAKNFFDIYGLDGKIKTTPLGKDEVCVSISYIQNDLYSMYYQIEISSALSLQYESFLSAYDNIFGSGQNASASDYEILIKTWAENYKEIMNVSEEYPSNWYVKNSEGKSSNLTVVGVFWSFDEYWDLVVNDSFKDEYSVNFYGDEEYYTEETSTSDYEQPADQKYIYAISNTDRSMEQSYFILEDRNNFDFGMTNQIYLQTSNMANMVDSLKLAFIIISSVFAVFSALMLFNFISTSISNKSKEIGILRAVGARGVDVFKIFFTEALMIAIICFMLSSIVAGVVCTFLNASLVNSIINLTLLDFNIINIALILVVSVFVSFIATLFPVYNAAKKSPVESIRAL